MSACAAFGCTRRPQSKTPGITFHKFPMDEMRRKIWIKNVRRKHWTPSKHSRLCSDHFEEEMFDRTSLCLVRLKEDAVPTIFKGFPSHLQQMPNSRKSQKRQERTQYHVKSSRTAAEKPKNKAPAVKEKVVNQICDSENEKDYPSDLLSQSEDLYSPAMPIVLINADVREYISNLVYNGETDIAVISSLVKMFAEKELSQLDKSDGQFYPNVHTIRMVVFQAKRKMAKMNERDEQSTSFEASNSSTHSSSVHNIEVVTNLGRNNTVDGEIDMDDALMDEELPDHVGLLGKPKPSESKEQLLINCEKRLQFIQSAMLLLGKQDLMKLLGKLNVVTKTVCLQEEIDNYLSPAE